MDTPTPASRSYDLAFVLDGQRFYWRNPNAGVTLTDAGRASSIAWQSEGRDESRLWTDIVSVTMSSATAGKEAINLCRIAFRDGRTITLTDAGANGLVDEARTPVYRDFVRALHARLVHAPEGTIAFNAGFSEGRYKAVQVLFVIATLFFVGTPFVLLFIVRRWEVLGVLAAGAIFVWPLWKVVEHNHPRSYDPRKPPGELME